MGLKNQNIAVLDPKSSPARALLVKQCMKMCEVTQTVAQNMLTDESYFGTMMLNAGLVDGFLTGVRVPYSQAIRPVLKNVKTRKGVSRASGLYVMIHKDRLLFFADATVQIDPDARQLAEIATNAAHIARYFNITPKIAMLSFANAGTSRHPEVLKVAKAVALLKKKRFKVAGPIQVDPAVDEKFAHLMTPDSVIQGDANVLVFPNLSSANIGYKLLQRLENVLAIGPLLMGMDKAVNIISQSSSTQDIVNLAALTIVQSEDF